MLIALAASKSYAMPLTTTLRSITESNRKHWPLEFLVLQEDFSPELQEKVLASLPEGSALIVWSPIETSLFAEFPAGATNYITKMAYARFLIPKILPETVSRVLYLDVDLLVFEDLAPLWQTDLKGAPLGAVIDRFLHTAYLEEGLDPETCRANHPLYKDTLPRVRNYLNSGVLLMDLDLWREQGFSEKVFDFLKQHPESPHIDQDALNFVFDKAWLELDPRWNIQNPFVKLGRHRKGIFHFITGKKPWLAKSRHPNAALYDSFRSRTRFGRTRLNKLWDFSVRLRTGVNNVLQRGGFRQRNREMANYGSLPAN